MNKSRRIFLKLLSLPFLGSCGLAPKRTLFQPFGSTGFSSFKIGFCAAQLAEGELLAYALERGFNLIDTAYSYSEGASERAVGEAIRNRHRDELFIVTKIPTLSRQYKKPPDPNRCLEISLKRMGLTHVDGLLLHNATVEAMTDKKMLGFLENKISEGTIRFAGISFHEQIKAHFDAALRNDLFQIIQYTPDQGPLPRIPGRAIMAKITHDWEILLPRYLGEPAFSSVLVTLKNFQQVDDCLKVKTNEDQRIHR